MISKINSAHLFRNNNPVILRLRVWFVVAIHLVSRGLEFHEQLKINSFILNTDDYGHVYATLSNETKQKNWQGGIVKQTPQKKKECLRFQILKNIVLSKHCPISSQKLTQTHQFSSTVVQSKLCLPQMMNLFDTQIRLSNIISLPDLCTISQKMQNALRHT